MSTTDSSAAIAACTALCMAHGALADAGDADAFAALYTEDGVFDRLGRLVRGQAAIRDVVAHRPAGVWTRHVCSGIEISVDDDGLGASGVVDLDMQRGVAGSDEVQHLRAVYHDRYALTDQGWRIRLRRVVLVPS